MVIRSPALAALTLIVVVGAACAIQDIDAPRGAPIDPGSAHATLPGAGAVARANNGTGQMRGCTPRDPQFGTAVIGPNGGDLIIGSHRLIVPPGALTEVTVVSGYVPTDSVFSIHLEPHGLTFKKPAGLQLDVSNCTDVPDIVYISELGVTSPDIPAVYSTLWHTIAAPIDHFSVYAIALAR